VGFGTYPSSRTARSTALRVAGLTWIVLLIAREAAERETPARSATSARVGARPVRPVMDPPAGVLIGARLSPGPAGQACFGRRRPRRLFTRQGDEQGITLTARRTGRSI